MKTGRKPFMYESSSKKNPYKALEEFFEWYSPENAAEQIRHLAARDRSGGWPVSDNVDTAFFQEKLNNLVEAAWTLSQSVPGTRD